MPTTAYFAHCRDRLRRGAVLTRDRLSLSEGTPRRSLLGCVLEVAPDKIGNIVFVLVALSVRHNVLDHLLEESELLGADLLEDLGHHVLELLSLGVARHDEEILSHRELDYTGFALELLPWGLLK